MQLQMPQNDIGAMLYLAQFILPSGGSTSTPIVLDIDLFREADIGLEELWDVFEILHDRKNKVFEGCITDKVRELIV